MAERKPPEFHRIIFDSLHEGLYSVDKNFRITGFNRAAERITGYRRDEVLGRYCRHVFQTDRCVQGCPLSYSLEIRENVKNYDLVLKSRDKKEVPVRVNAAIFNDTDNEPVGGVVIFRTVVEPDPAGGGKLLRREFEGNVGHNRQMQEIYTLIEEIRDSDAGVMIQGESGTGKELIANAVQNTSLRRNKPYIKVNCSVFPHDLLASELFGHVKGAFTDAHRDRVGRFEMANGGTLFLDEIAEADARIQVQLLRVLQEGTFERVGESVTRKVDVRVIAATNLKIQEAISKGRFREDLFYRLNVIPINLPPLRERKDDIPLLIDHFLKKLSIQNGKKILEINDIAMALLMEYDWPGNIRELENVIEYAHTRTRGTVVTKVAGFRKTDRVPATEVERIREALEKSHWNRSRAAEMLEMGRATLWRKMKSYGLL
jgi:PAS domain S-box-containing protein